MKSILTGILSLCLATTLIAQKTEVISEEIALDFTDPLFTLEWISPQGDSAEIIGLETTIRFGIISKEEIELVNIFVNGSPEKPSNPYRSLSDVIYTKLIEKDVKLRSGNNEILIAIKDIEGNRQKFSKEIIANSLVTLASLGKKDRALIIATDEYDEWGNLVNPIEDATAIADELSTYYGFDVDVVENPTQEEMMLKIREYSQKDYNEYDQLFIFIAGHGQFDEAYGQGYIVARDSKIDDAAKTSYISHSNLRTAIDNIDCRHVFLVMDACFGGTFDPTIAASGSRGNEELYTELNSVSYFKKKMRFVTRKYLTSGGKEYVSDGVPGLHSPFAAKFLEALRSYGGRDEFLTLSEINNYMERLPQEARSGSFGRNQPGSDFLFVAVEK